MKMFTKHVTKQLSAYCNGELADAESRRVQEHLLSCLRCRREYGAIKLGADFAAKLSAVSAPADLWSKIEEMLDPQTRKQLSQIAPRSRFAFNWYQVAAVSAVLVVAVAIGLWWSAYEGPKVSLAVREAVGNVRIDGKRVVDAGKLSLGGALETGSSSGATITVADIGDVEVDPNTRIRLVKTQSDEHRLALDHGRMKATISAPPRLFFVDTPSAEAIDLGCVYTLEVNDAGSSLLHVTLGWVALVRNGREVYVPRYAMCQARLGIGVGTPYFEDASDDFVRALERFDFEGGGDDALAAVMSEARDRDTFTLWHLLTRVEGDRRVRVLNRMIELVGLPKAISRDATLKLDPDTLEMWKDELDTIWF
jgi:ferric-dicitrate binding protein FerR (iron transport regulator)